MEIPTYYIYINTYLLYTYLLMMQDIRCQNMLLACHRKRLGVY